MIKTNTIPANTRDETILIVNHQYFNHIMNITIGVTKTILVTDMATMTLTKPEVIVNYERPLTDIPVSENNYKAIMSGNPSWSASKSKDLYSEDDLWLVIEAERAGVDLAIGT